MKQPIEASYPITFRKKDAQTLGSTILHRYSVVLIGMKRVGISNFLRFFLNHKEIAKTYIKNGSSNLFVRIDLNDLVERDLYPFWTLMLKRIVDTVEQSNLPETVKKNAQKALSDSIQLKDLFFTVDSIRDIISIIVSNGFYPTLFLMRFDRMQDAMTLECFRNLQSLIDSSNQKLSFVFTSFRPLHQLVPEVFTKQSLSSFSQNMYLTPASHDDIKILAKVYQTQYKESFLNEKTLSLLIEITGGHTQYLYLAGIKIYKTKQKLESKKDIITLMANDEEITLLSEELFESLTNDEKEILLKIKGKSVITASMRKKAPYLWDTGMIKETKGKNEIFNPLFAQYLEKISANKKKKQEFTKKEHLLFSFLKEHEGKICEREDIIQSVWPEQAELGVSDWAIDRLVARVRAKLKNQQSEFEIITIVTRGYKLAKKT